MKITVKKAITILTLIGAVGGALAGIKMYEEMNLPRPAMKSELQIVVAENLETKQMILEESIDRKQLQIYQNQRVQQEYQLEQKPIPESLVREEFLLKNKTDELEDELDVVKQRRIDED